jgi:hypothetical protein
VPSENSKTVELTIDYADGVQKRFVSIPWKDEMTVIDAMEFAAQHPRGIRFECRGRDATALLLQIDDLRNQGGSGLNWIYRVNGKLGDRSLATFRLQPGDAILWKFDEYR